MSMLLLSYKFKKFVFRCKMDFSKEVLMVFAEQNWNSGLNVINKFFSRFQNIKIIKFCP